MIFGAEDSLVSTVGVLFGIASTTSETGIMVLTGLVVIVVEAISMGAGAFLSETSSQEVNGMQEEQGSTILDGVIMFLSYFIAGFIPLSPYLFIHVGYAKYISILCSLIALFFLGFIPQKRASSGIRMVVIAGIAIFMGFVIAHITEAYL